MPAFKLSPTTLNLFLECRRCFWLDKIKNFKRPRGIFPSLPTGMDREIKNHFDAFRARHKLPPELSGENFTGCELYPDQLKLDQWRDWRKGLEYKSGNGAVLSGAIDELLVKGNRYIPFDYKTKGSPTTPEDAVRYYQNQLDCYALLLQENGMSAADYGFLLYYSPKSIGENGAAVFEVQPIRVPVDYERGRRTFESAVTLLAREMPGSAPGCEYCGWIAKYKELFDKADFF